MFSAKSQCTIYLTELYLLSRFSSSPSQKIREHILSLEPALQDYEPDKLSVKDWDGECNLSTDVLVSILSQTDPITQLLTVPLVCKAWTGLRKQLLKISPAIHSLFMSDLAKYEFDKIHHYLPWRTIFRSTADVVEFFARIASFTCAVPEGNEYRQLCQHYFKNLPAPQFSHNLTAVEHYAEEYARLGVNENCQSSSRPFLYPPTNMTSEEYLEVIRKLVSAYSIVPRIPWECLSERLIEIYDAINDDKAFEAILKMDFSNGYDTLCANILAQQVAVPPGLVRILSSGAKVFDSLFATKISFPLTLDSLSNNPDLMVNIIDYVSGGLQKRAYELLVHVLCHLQDDQDRIASMTRALRGHSVSLPSNLSIAVHARKCTGIFN